MKYSIIIIMLLSSVLSNAQHDMKNMPGMKMPAAKKETGKVPAKKMAGKPVQKVTYTCTMHPEIHSAKPGNCPKCGMKLIKEKPIAAAKPAVQGHDLKDMKMPTSKKETKEIKAQSATYTCPMHPEIHAAKPGNCPKCGMKLIKEQSAASTEHNHDEMQMDKDTSMQMSLDKSNTSADKKMDDMQILSNQNKSITQPVSYTCPMHPEIHATKPGNCPKCGMKLVKEKPKGNADNKMKNDMKMGDMKMPVKDADKKMDDMSGMQMDGMQMGDGITTMDNIMMAKRT